MSHKHPKLIRAEKKARIGRQNYVEETMTDFLAHQISTEIDKTIVDRLVNEAKKKTS